MKIGILDSGMAGLVVTRYLAQSFPDNQFVYFGDTAHMPYDSKSPDRIRQWSLSGTQMLIRQHIDVLVVSCPTIASMAVEPIRSAVDVPVIDPIALQLAPVTQNSKGRRIGILGVQAVVDSRRYNRLIRSNNPAAKIYTTTCPLLPHLIENGWVQKPETRMIVKKYLFPLKIRQIDTLILGSNHAVFVRNLIQAKIGKRVWLIDPFAQLVCNLQALNADGLKFRSDAPMIKHMRVLVNDLTDHVHALADMFLRQKIPLEFVMV